MSQEITLASSAGLPALPDWGGALGAPVDQTTPLRKMHRLLRGRYGLALTLALIGGTIGAAIGWFTQKQKYESTALIQIRPIVQSILYNDKTIPFYDKFVQSQPAVITTTRVIEAALQSPEWKATGLGSGPEMIGTIKNNLEATYQKNTQLLQVTYNDLRPDIAQAALRAVMHAYRAGYDEFSGRDLEDSINRLEDMRTSREAAIRGNQQQIAMLAEKYGTEELQLLHNAKMTKVLELNNRVLDAEDQLKRIQGTAGKNLTIEQIAQMDATMRGLVQNQSNYSFRVEQLKGQGIGEQSRILKEMQNLYDLTTKQINTYADLFREQFKGGFLLDEKLDKKPVSPQDIDGLVQIIGDNKKRLEKEQAELKDVGQIQVKMKRLRDDIDTWRGELLQANHKLDEKMAQASMTGTLQIIDDGGAAVPSTDNRKKFAFLGFVVGGGLPIGLLLLIGLLDGRYRYSEETSDDMAGMILLGILPNLPDRLTDPDQAATAAHCVHQIRTMLQINGGDERRVYCVTSASPGDGKTSLTLALGLSFAASGSRTLLIDCDLVGAGLTARLDMAGPEGVLEAMSNRALLEYIRTTDVPDLAMLPVGSAQSHHAGMFSPQALRRLVAEARKHFEVVLIDTGPILGSIEATPVCAAADGVILTVSRGQQRPLVEKAIQHLQSIGAKFAGVVFNRAQHRDFERSVSGMSLRSVARSHQQPRNGNGNGGHKKEGQALGPVAKAVASSFRPPEGRS